jgi:hypothetical protein
MAGSYGNTGTPGEADGHKMIRSGHGRLQILWTGIWSRGKSGASLILAASSATEQFSRESAKVSRAQQRARMNAGSDSVDVDVDVDERD